MESPIGVFSAPIVPQDFILHQRQHQFLLQQQQHNLDDLLFQQQKKNQDYKRMDMAAPRCTWRFPEYNTLKLNTDGSSKGNPGPASFGGLIRDGRGKWLCGYMGKMKGRWYTSLEAEIWSIFKGMCLIKEKKLSCMLIETDCQGALLLQLNEESHPLKSVMDAINRMMMEQRCILVHTRRDGNQCADELAKLGGRQSEEYVVLEKPPMSLMPYLFRDIASAQRNGQ